jgi:hypothetical protein
MCTKSSSLPEAVAYLPLAVAALLVSFLSPRQLYAAECEKQELSIQYMKLIGQPILEAGKRRPWQGSTPKPVALTIYVEKVEALRLLPLALKYRNCRISFYVNHEKLYEQAVENAFPFLIIGKPTPRITLILDEEHRSILEVTSEQYPHPAITATIE